MEMYFNTTLGPLSLAVAPLSIHSAVTVSVYYCGFRKFMSGPFLLRARHRLCAEAALLCFDESSFPPSPITVSQTGTVSFILRPPLKIKRGIRYLICPRQRANPCPSCPCCFWIVLIACWNILRFTETNGLNPRAKHRLYKGTKDKG